MPAPWKHDKDPLLVVVGSVILVSPPQGGRGKVYRTEAADMQDERTTDIVRRLKSVEGHVRGVERMVGEDAYCIDVVNQILAIQRALKKVSGLVLDQHLHHCVTSAIRGTDDNEKEQVLGELLQVFEATGKA